MKFKSIFKPAAAVLAAAIALASCEVDTTTVMFEEDHNFSDPTDTVFSMLGVYAVSSSVLDLWLLIAIGLAPEESTVEISNVKLFEVK